ncbi:hypothetical protein QW060_02915 [Myroides ceti]|uniref:Phage protein n=1 Tax=Paenimyroides ceti TaxID=395087 RepID=A0ABT8CS77_9FLAO|nr:hypothetical protein [Paenimyroides ceti]MDN3706072.1 hypothetical protein [Paenimyroides ceti]
MSKPIEELIPLDLTTFLELKSRNAAIDSAAAIEIGAYVAANFMRIIFTKNKAITKEEINGVFGIVSNFYNEFFEGQLLKEDYIEMSDLAMNLLKDADFDDNSKRFFQKIIDEAEQQ